MLVNVCTLSDDNYAQHLGVMIASILINSSQSDELFFHILDGGITEENKLKIKELEKIKEFSIKYYIMDNSELNECPATYLPIASYYNFLPQKYLTDVERIVFLDSDMVILDSLELLYNLDMKGKIIAACEDPISENNKVRLGIPNEYFYFNTGTMLMDLEAWRQQDILSKLLKYVVEYPDKIEFMDQDVLNDVLYEQSLILPLKWNSIHYPHGHTYKNINEYEQALETPAIIHYAMADKPWKYPSKVFRREEYFKILELTPWHKGKLFGKYSTKQFVLYNIHAAKCKIKNFFKFRFLVKPIEIYLKNKK